SLQIGVAGNNDFLFPLAQLHERPLKRANLLREGVDLIDQPQPHIQGDLVVARAASVDFCAGRYPTSQFGFDVHVNVFQFGSPAKFPSRDFPFDCVQPLLNGTQFGPGQHSNFAEHRSMGAGATDIMTPQPPIKGDRLRELRHRSGWTSGEPSAARDRRSCFHARKTCSMCGETASKSLANCRRSQVWSLNIDALENPTRIHPRMRPLPDKFLGAMIAVMPLPGSPRYEGNEERILAQALSDLAHYQRAGVDAIILENSHDLPYTKPPLPPRAV